MKKSVSVVVLLGGCLLGTVPAWAVSPETQMLLDLLQAKGVISQKEAVEFSKTVEAKAAATVPESEHQDQGRSPVESRAERAEKIEGQAATEGAGELLNKIQVTGLIKGNAVASRHTDAVGEKTSSSDLVLDTAELKAHATVNPYVSGHITLLYEESANNDNIGLDEAVITVRGGDSCPAYANVGRQYVPFGHFSTRFISDTLPQTLGETNDTAAVLGYGNDMVDLNVGLFRGKVKEAGTNDQINSTVASLSLSLPKGEVQALAMSGGVSYLSNLAGSDALSDTANAVGPGVTTPGVVADAVGAAEAFLNLSYGERIFFDAEYLGAVADFTPGDLNFVDANNRRPRAWNLEAAAKLCEVSQLAVRYGGSNEAGSFLADHEYGAVLTYSIFADTSLSLEYLFQKFQDESDNRQTTLQLAVEF